MHMAFLTRVERQAELPMGKSQLLTLEVCCGHGWWLLTAVPESGEAPSRASSLEGWLGARGAMLLVAGCRPAGSFVLGAASWGARGVGVWTRVADPLGALL